MSQVIAGMTMSLDGFVNDRHGSVARLYPDLAALRQTSELQEAIAETGAVVMGRRSYDMGGGDFTGYEFQVPIFVLTHRPPERAAEGENDRLTFSFVADGIDRAIAAAKAAAGDKEVTVVGGADTIRQCLQAGLVDELRLDLRPVLLGDGLRLFDRLEGLPGDLETIRLASSPGVLHLRFRVVRSPLRERLAE